MALSAWKSPKEADLFFDARGTGFIFKHSTQCSVSSEAERAFTDFVRENPEVPVYRVLVIESRPTSLHIADRLAIPHASPQAILVVDGEVSWNASHFDIDLETLEKAWSDGGVCRNA